MAAKPEGTWAAEVFDSLRLFHRVGRSLIGLLLLCLLWTLFILLLSELAYNKDGPPTLQFPLMHGPKEVSVSNILWSGLLGILFWWCFYSQIYKCLYGPTAWLVAVVGTPLCIAHMVLFALVSLPLLLLTWPLEALLVSRWFRSIDPAKLNDLRKKYPDKVLRNVALDEVGFDRWVLFRQGSRLAATILRHIHSPCRIGLAPLASSTYEEDLLASKAPLQSFAWAVNRVTTGLRALEVMDWIAFTSLPPAFSVAPGMAQFCRRLFGLDVLLWGSYVGGDTKMIWLNVQRPRIGAERKTPLEDGSVRDVARPSELFPGFFTKGLSVEVSAVTIAQDDPWDAYAVLLLIILLVIEDRHERRKKTWLSQWDRMYGAYRDKEDVLEVLAYEAFAVLPNEPLTKKFFWSAKEVLTRAVSDWIGHMLQSFSKMPDDRLVKTLHVMANKCTKLMPNSPEHFYRLGAIECLLGNADAALMAFKQAGKLESADGSLDPIIPLSKAHTVLSSPEAIANGEVVLAQFAAYAVRTINTGNMFASRSLRKDMDKSACIKLLDAMGKSSIAVEVVRTLLDEADHQSIELLARQKWEREGRPEGRHLEHWLDATKEINS